MASGACSTTAWKRSGAAFSACILKLLCAGRRLTGGAAKLSCCDIRKQRWFRADQALPVMQTWDEIRQWRKAQRAELIARRTAAPVEERRRWSDAITRMLVDEFPLLQWMTIGFYWPIQGEFDPRFAMREF